jgi:Bacterial regulatory protein, Fis family
VQISSSVPLNGPTPVTPNSDDGLDHVFADTVSDAMSDTRRSKKVELPIAEAAKVLGVSERTLWRRIEEGELKSRLKGNKRFVRVPIDQTVLTPDTANESGVSVTARQVGTIVNLDEVLKQLTGANYRIGFLQAQLEAKEQQLRLLPDLQSKAEEAAHLTARLAAAEAEIEYLKKPWWKVLFGI